MSNRQQLRIFNIFIPPNSSCSAGHNTAIPHLLGNNEMSHSVGDINAHHSIWDTITNGEERVDIQLTKSMQPSTPFSTIMKIRGYRQMDGKHRLTYLWSPMTSHYHQTGQSLPLLSAINCPSSSPSTPKCQRLLGLG